MPPNVHFEPVVLPEQIPEPLIFPALLVQQQPWPVEPLTHAVVYSKAFGLAAEEPISLLHSNIAPSLFLLLLP
jgi:hypothetical protein